MSSFEDRVGAVVQGILADQMNWPPEMTSAIPQIVAQSPFPVAQAAGDIIDSGSITSPITTTGTTFATGADFLSTPITFTSQGGNQYLLVVSAPGWYNSGGNDMLIHLNLDGADGGFFADYKPSGATLPVPLYAAAPFQTTGGSHTVNARLVVAAGTGTIEIGNGGAGTANWGHLALYRI